MDVLKTYTRSRNTMYYGKMVIKNSHLQNTKDKQENTRKAFEV